jgi:hypothetical protein
VLSRCANHNGGFSLKTHQGLLMLVIKWIVRLDLL